VVQIRCIVERITYQNPDNGYSVLKVWVKGYKELIPLVGNLIVSRKPLVRRVVQKSLWR